MQASKKFLIFMFSDSGYFILTPKLCVNVLFVIIKYSKFMKFNQWDNFQKGDWQNEINVRDFIQKNYTPYRENDNQIASQQTEAQFFQLLL